MSVSGPARSLNATTQTPIPVSMPQNSPRLWITQPLGPFSVTQPPVYHATSRLSRNLSSSAPLYSPQLSSAQLSSALLSDQCPALCSALYSGHPPSPSLTSVQNIILIRSGYDVMWCGVLLYPTLAPSTSINQNLNRIGFETDSNTTHRVCIRKRDNVYCSWYVTGRRYLIYKTQNIYYYY